MHHGADWAVPRGVPFLIGVDRGADRAVLRGVPLFIGVDQNEPLFLEFNENSKRSVEV
jgi:hypothetical protein